MSSFARCVHCRRRLRIPEGSLGRSLRCPGCGETFVIDAMADEVPELQTSSRPQPAYARVHEEEEPVEEAYLVESTSSYVKKGRDRFRWLLLLFAAFPLILTPVLTIVSSLFVPASPLAASVLGVLAGLVLALMGVGLAFLRSWPLSLRIVLSLALSFLGVTGACGFCWLSWAFPARIDASEWQSCEPSNGGFRVLMPGLPKMDNQDVLGFGPNSKFTRYTVTLDRHRQAYAVGFQDISEFSTAFGPDWVFTAGKDSTLKLLKNPKVENEKRINLGAYPGWEVKARDDDDMLIVFRMYLVGNRYYVVSAAFPAHLDPSPDADKFFNSFQITGPAAGR